MFFKRFSYFLFTQTWFNSSFFYRRSILDIYLILCFCSVREREKRRHIPNRHEINGSTRVREKKMNGKRLKIILNSTALEKKKERARKKKMNEDFARDGNKTWFFSNLQCVCVFFFGPFHFYAIVFLSLRFDIKAHCLISHLFPLILEGADKNNLIISAEERKEGKVNKRKNFFCFSLLFRHAMERTKKFFRKWLVVNN